MLSWQAVRSLIEPCHAGHGGAERNLGFMPTALPNGKLDAASHYLWRTHQANGTDDVFTPLNAAINFDARTWHAVAGETEIAPTSERGNYNR